MSLAGNKEICKDSQCKVRRFPLMRLWIAALAVAVSIFVLLCIWARCLDGISAG